MDYLLSSIPNNQFLKVPLMVLFEFKGFVGLARSRLPDGSYRNRELYDLLDKREFEENARINA